MLFTGVRGIGILRSSHKRNSAKFTVARLLASPLPYTNRGGGAQHLALCPTPNAMFVAVI
jgi:hypothetical protein